MTKENSTMTRKFRNAALFVAVVAVAVVAASCTSSGGGYNSNPTAPPPPPGTPPPAKELDSGNIGTAGSYQHRFVSAGTYNYHCIYHGPMTGSVQVTDAAADTVATVTITTDTAPFPGASVKPGGRVVWNNNSTMIHTVTSN
jgi:plastocyanin